MDNVIMFFAVVLSVLFHPIRMIKEVLKLGNWFLFGDPMPKGQDHASLHSEYIKYYSDLNDLWTDATPAQREQMKPVVKSFAQKCRIYNKTLPPGSPYRLNF